MYFKLGYLYLAIVLGLVLFAVISLVSEGPSVLIRYSVDNSTVYLVNDTVFSYSYLSPSAVSKCSSPVEQRDCFNSTDYLVKSVNLTENQVDSLTENVSESDYFDLEDSYGNETTQGKTSVESLDVAFGWANKTVVYVKTGDSVPAPKAFEKVIGLLSSLEKK